MARPEIREALFLASPALEEMLPPWLEGRLSPEKADRVDRALVRYLTRMATRCTPFGLFAATSLGRFHDTSRLSTGAWRAGKRRTRLDTGYLFSLVEALERDRTLRPFLRYHPNSGGYFAAGQYRFAEGRTGADRSREYRLVALERTPYLEATLQRAADGATLEALTLPLAQEDIPLEEAEAFIHELIDLQALVSDLQPAITGPEPLALLAGKLRRIPAAQTAADRLEAVGEELRALDREPLGQPPGRYRALARTLEPLPATVKMESLFQVDLAKPTPGASLGRKVQEALTKAVALLWQVSPPPGATTLQAFARAFGDRYGDRWMPLLETLDEETGIGFGAVAGLAGEMAPLLDGLAFHPPGPGPSPALTGRDAFLLARLQDLGPTPTWELTDADLKALRCQDPPELPDTFACLAVLAATGPEALDQGYFQVLLEAFYGPSGARLLGRFCHGDATLAEQVRAHLRAEEALRADSVFAEIVHLPEGRMGNVLCRPVLRDYEIPILGVSGAPAPCRLHPQDLQVSVRNGRVLLRSRSLGREVRPRLTSAHNYGRGIGVYRFLGALQDQDGFSGGWSWGAAEELPFLPRVCRGRQVLQRARWLVRREEWAGPADKPGKPSCAAFGQFRERRGLPCRAVLADGDNEWLVDFQQPLWLETFLHMVADRPNFVLKECFPGPGELPARAPEGRFCHELVLPFVRQGPSREAPALLEAAPRPGSAPLPPRTFLPGSEWLYLKIYSGISTAERILGQVLPSFLADNAACFDRWFFIRYADPDPHLRLRFQGRPAALTTELLPRLHRLLAPLQEAGWVWKLQVETYEREMERYGGSAGILATEAIFAHDSRAVLELLQAYPGDAAVSWRWRMGFKAVDLFLDDLGLDLQAKSAALDRARSRLAQDLGADRGLELRLGAKHRALRGDLEGLLAGTDPAGEAGAGLEILAARSRSWRGDLDTLRQAQAAGTLREKTADLAVSFTHMHLNRLLRSSQPAQEFVIYDFLCRSYRSRAACTKEGLP